MLQRCGDRVSLRLLFRSQPSIRQLALKSVRGVLAVLFGVVASTAAFAQSICATTSLPTYFYDAGGRLGAVLGATSTANYAYDLAGNILSVTQTANTALQVLQVCPNAAQIGQVVTIWGTGFTASPAVTFNGVAAVSATLVSANEITVTVPSGATSGVVGVKPSGGAAVTSVSSFNVGAVAPQITALSGGATVNGFTALNPLPYYDSASTAAYIAANPSAIDTGVILGAASGTQSLTITGTGFDTTAPLISTKNKVWIGSRAAQITSSSATSLTVNVPVGGSAIKSGPVPVVTVETPAGIATFATQSVLLTPAGLTPSLINLKSIGSQTSQQASADQITAGVDSTEIDNVTDALTIGGAAQTLNFTVNSAQHFVAFMFSGSAGTTVNAHVSIASASTNAAVLLVGPDGDEVASADLGGAYPPIGTSNTQEFWKLPQTGTYTILVQNALASASASAKVSLAIVPATTSLGTLTAGSSVSGSVAGFQAATATFAVAQGSSGRVTLTTTLGAATASPFLVSVTAPDGATQVYSNQSPKEGDNKGFLQPGKFDFSGPVSVPATAAGTTYTVTYQSLSTSSTVVKLALASLPADIQATACSAWPSSGATATCSGTISAPGQAVYASLASTTAFTSGSSPSIGTLQTVATSFTGCFEVLVTDTALNSQFYRSLQCGGADYSYALQFPANSIGPYMVQAFGIGSNTGKITFNLSTAAPLTTIQQTTVGDSSPPTTNFTGPGQTAEIVLNGASPGEWIQLTTTPSNLPQCFVALINAQGGPARNAFGTYLECATGSPSGVLGSLQLPYAVASNYDIFLTPLTPPGTTTGFGSVQTTVSSATAAPTGTIPVNGSIYGTGTPSQTVLTNTFVPTVGTNGSSIGYFDLVTLPNVTNTNGSPEGQTNANQSCYDTQLFQPSGSSTPIFDNVNQTFGYQVGVAAGCTSIDVSATQQLTGTSQGSVIFNLNNASTVPNSWSFSQTLYNYAAVSAPSAIAAPSGAPAGITLPSTLPGQPVTAQFTTTSGESFIRVVVGLDANLAAASAFVLIQDVTTNHTLPGGGYAMTEPMSSSGAFSINPGDTIQVTVEPQGNAVGNISIGVGGQ